MPKAFLNRSFEVGERARVEDGHGYASNGEGEYTRIAAHGGSAGPRRDASAPRERPSQVNGYLPSDEKIRRTQIAIGTIESKLMFEQRIDSRSPKVAKLQKDLRIKRAFLTQLGLERNNPNHVREKIRV